MTQKLRKTLIMVVMAALIICLMAASLTYTFTYGRYAGGKFDNENSPYGDLIEFVGANQYIVRTPEELIQAIKDGYSNIKIADNAEEPFVIDTGVTDVSANLVLDVNGKTLIRNSRNPMLDVQTNVSVVLIYDSSDEEQGGFYNPVGSALQASGGTLTVGSGNYDDGPRAKEYQGNEAAGTLGNAANATLFARSNETNNAVSGPTKLDRSQYISGYSPVSDVSLPKITPEKTQENNRETVRGNVYLSSNHSDWLPADTFLVYTVEENCFIGNGQTSGGVTFTKNQLYVNAESEKVGNVTTVTASEFTKPLCNVASCDFYYYYPIDKEGNPIDTAGTADSPQDYAVIYGYWDVMALARDDGGAAKALTGNGLIWPYAAVRMVEGEGFARGGQFSNNFGTVNSYGIYANGGALTASGANFTTGGDGVCIRCEGSASLSIGGGTYSSEIGNTIEMVGGKMTVTKGTFTKDASSADTNSTDNGSAIDIQGGALNSSKSESTEEKKPIQFKISGSHVNGIHAAGGEVNIANASFVFDGGKNNQGIYNDGGTSRAHWCDFSIPGNNNYGIHSTNGTTRASDCNITMTGDYVVGVYTTGGRALIEGGSIKVNFAEDEEDKNDKLLTSTAVSTEGGEIYLAGSLKIESDSLGVTVRGNANMSGSLEIASDTITTGDGTTYPDITPGNVEIKTQNATGIYVNNGNLTNKGTVTVTSSVGNEEGADNGWKWVNAEGKPLDSFNKYNGVYVQGGSLISEGTLNVTFTGVAADPDETTSFPTDVQTKSYAVYVDTEADASASDTVTVAGGTINAAQAGGVYVENGAVSLGASSKNVTINTGGWNNTQDQIVSTQGTYASAVYAHGGSVKIKGTVDINSAALGIVAVGVVNTDGSTAAGAVTIESGTTTIKAYRSTGVYIRGGSLTNNGTLTVTSTIKNSTGGTANTATEAYKWAGADIEDDLNNSNIYNGVYVKGGSLISNGTLNVTFTGVQNDAPAADADGDSLFRTFAIKSYAVRVEAEEGTSATVTITSGKITNAVGGGVLVNGGTVHLGGYVDENGTAHISQNPVTVQTTGTGYHHNENNDADYRYRPDFSTADNWYYYLPSTGGPAVKVAGGTLTIYNGDYSAAQGDGIVTVNGMTTINDGRFRGNDNYNTQYENGQLIPQAGPGASYAFKVYGGTAEVYGGTFGGNINNVWSKTSGAFVMGTSDVRGTANIYGGTFEVGGGNNGNEGGQAGFSIYQYATVNFAPQDGKKILVNGRATAIAIEQTDGNSNSTVTISGGNFASTSKVLDNSDGIWYGNGSTTLNISSGTFTGAKRSGLWLDVRVPENGNVHLTGGTYYGNPVRSGSWPAYYWNNGGISAQSNGLIDGNGYWIGVNYIFDDGYKARCYYDDSYHDEYDDSALNQTTSRSERVDILQR